MTIRQKTFAPSSLLLLIMAVTGSPIFAQADRPNLQGIWTNASLTSLQRPEGVENLIVTPERARAIAAVTPIAGIEGGLDEGDGVNDTPEAGADDFGTRAYNNFWVSPGSNLALVKGEFRTSYIVDPPSGRIPRKEEPQYDFDRANFGNRYATGVADYSGPEAFPNAERCLLGFGNKAGPGMMGALYNNTYQFVQTDDYVMVLVEMVHDARIIPIFDTPEEARANRRPMPLEQWFGDSVGWYEGDALVIETTNIHPQQMSQSSIPITKDGRITEKFSRYSDNEIFYQFIVEDDNIYQQEWTAELSFYASPEPWYEYACHEGNYSMPGSLAGARRLELDALGQ